MRHPWWGEAPEERNDWSKSKSKNAKDRLARTLDAPSRGQDAPTARPV